MSCCCGSPSKCIVTHQTCGPCTPYFGPNLSTPSQYLFWSARPIISHLSTDEVKQTWNLKRRTPNIPDIYYEEMKDRCGERYF